MSISINNNNVRDEVWDVVAKSGFHGPDLANVNLDFKSLMHVRFNRILLVSSLYDYYTMVEDGQLTEAIFNEFFELNVHYATHISRVNSGEAALKIMREQHFDLVITMQRLEDMSLIDFGKAVKHENHDIPIVLLANQSRELEMLMEDGQTAVFDHVFIWHGDTRLFLAIIKLFEDKQNAPIDCLEMGVRTIILVEDSPLFYSSYLPLIYTELIQQVQDLIKEGKNFADKLLRQRARPKILLATNYEEAMEHFDQYKDTLLGIITDMTYSKNGVEVDDAGYQLIKAVRSVDPELPILMQSATGTKLEVDDVNVGFAHKNSRTLFQELRDFIKSKFGFGDFVFIMPDGREVARAGNLRELRDGLRYIPEDCLAYHASRNHFSNWLMARTRFALATKMKPVKIDDFKSMEELRQYLIKDITYVLAKERHGIIADFSRDAYDADIGFLKIDTGSLGGKARGLAFVDHVLKRYIDSSFFPDVRISIPKTIVLGTDVFRQFMEMNDLLPYAIQNVSDEAIVRAFIHADFPPTVLGDLREILDQARYPLAIRSSSLLEDALYQPFAGIYATVMIPNSNFNSDVRFQNLMQAIKFVYASTYFHGAKNYIEATGHRIEEEQMAVIIQEMVGTKYDRYFYPHISGVARSYNYYPFGKATPKDGIANVALGLGKTIVDGGLSLQFSPPYPKVLAQFDTRKDLFANSQVKFFAVDLMTDILRKYPKEDQHLVELSISDAEEHGTLRWLVSTYVRENDMLVEGINRKGPRILDFAPILKSEVVPMAKLLQLMTDLCETAMNCPVEIEFCLKLSDEKAVPAELSVLQVRPMVKQDETIRVDASEYSNDDLLILTDNTLGNGSSVVHDIIYVKPDVFDPMKTRIIAEQLGIMNAQLLKYRAPYMLIGPGRWGSSDPSLGVPVQFPSISGARAIVETSLPNLMADPSQGSHFFQNLTSFRIAYLTLRHYDKGHFIDYEWLDQQQVVEESTYLKHIRVDTPVQIIVDGTTGKGLVLKEARMG
jgi:pyruvate phosphate dikinase-like enzyme/uncharacterized protein DUF5752